MSLYAAQLADPVGGVPARTGAGAGIIAADTVPAKREPVSAVNKGGRAGHRRLPGYEVEHQRPPGIDVDPEPVAGRVQDEIHIQQIRAHHKDAFVRSRQRVGSRERHTPGDLAVDAVGQTA